MIYIIIGFFTALFLLVRLFASPDLKLYKHVGIFTKIRIFLFQPKCHYCGQIACTEVIGIDYHCHSEQCVSKSIIRRHNMSYCMHLIDSLGNKLNKIK